MFHVKHLPYKHIKIQNKTIMFHVKRLVIVRYNVTNIILYIMYN